MYLLSPRSSFYKITLFFRFFSHVFVFVSFHLHVFPSALFLICLSEGLFFLLWGKGRGGVKEGRDLEFYLNCSKIKFEEF